MMFLKQERGVMMSAVWGGGGEARGATVQGGEGGAIERGGSSGSEARAAKARAASWRGQRSEGEGSGREGSRGGGGRWRRGEDSEVVTTSCEAMCDCEAVAVRAR